jgi:hypothetical protein
VESLKGKQPSIRTKGDFCPRLSNAEATFVIDLASEIARRLMMRAVPKKPSREDRFAKAASLARF